MGVAVAGGVQRRDTLCHANAPPTSLLCPAGKGKGKASAAPEEAAGAASEDSAEADIFEEESAVAMASMDIFAGCGGLSEGMHQAGVAVTK